MRSEIKLFVINILNHSFEYDSYANGNISQREYSFGFVFTLWENEIFYFVYYLMYSNNNIGMVDVLY